MRSESAVYGLGSLSDVSEATRAHQAVDTISALAVVISSNFKSNIFCVGDRICLLYVGACYTWFLAAGASGLLGGRFL